MRYPTTNVAELYKIATIVLRRRRKAFQEGLGKTVNVCCEELGQRGEPVEQPISDVLALSLLPVLASASELFEGYQQAVSLGHGLAYLQALRQHSDQAAHILERWLNGNCAHEAVFVSHTSAILSSEEQDHDREIEV